MVPPNFKRNWEIKSLVKHLLLSKRSMWAVRSMNLWWAVSSLCQTILHGTSPYYLPIQMSTVSHSTFVAFKKNSIIRFWAWSIRYLLYVFLLLFILYFSFYYADNILYIIHNTLCIHCSDEWKILALDLILNILFRKLFLWVKHPEFSYPYNTEIDIWMTQEEMDSVNISWETIFLM